MGSTRRDLSQLESDVELLTSRTSEAVSKCSTRRQVKHAVALDARTKEYDDRWPLTTATTATTAG